MFQNWEDHKEYEVSISLDKSHNNNRNKRGIARFISQDLPDFDVSQVIAKNQPIDVKCDEDKPLEQFFIRMNELGYDTNLSQHTVFVEEPTLSHPSSNEELFPRIKIHKRASPFEQSQILSKYRPQKTFQKKYEKIMSNMKVNLAQLDFQRIQITDYVRQMQRSFTKMIDACQQNFFEFLNKYQIQNNQQKQRIYDLEHQLEGQSSRIDQLEKTRRQMTVDEQSLQVKLEDMEQQQHKLIAQIQQLQNQNSQLKFDSQTIEDYQKKCDQLEQQLKQANQIVEHNSQYIFDLEQKIAETNFELQEKQSNIRKEYDLILQTQREKIEQTYKKEFDKIQDDIKEKIQDELEQQYQANLENTLIHHKNQIDNLRKVYQKDISDLQQERFQLINSSRDMQSRMHEIEQTVQTDKHKQMKRHQEEARIQQLERKYSDLEQRIRDKDVQLNYYRELSNKMDNFSNYPKKTTNILVLDDHHREKSICRETSISPNSSSPYLNHSYGHGKDQAINNILGRIRMRNGGSILSNVNDISIESIQARKTGINKPSLKPSSPESMLLERQKDVRMRNISHKLEQLRADIRRQIGMMKN